MFMDAGTLDFFFRAHWQPQGGVVGELRKKECRAISSNRSGVSTDKHRRSYKHGRSYRSECQGTRLPGVLVRLSCLLLAPLRELGTSRFQPQIVARPGRYKRKLE
jgi:hypothetical protein